MLIKRALRQKRHIYQAIRRAKENYSFEERQFSISVKVEEMLSVE
jgi:hypothetical protein